MPEAIPITPEIKVDVGRIRFGEAAHHPDAIKTRFKELLDQDRAEQALKELAEPRHVPHDRRDVESSLLKRYSTLRDTEGKKVAPTDPKEMWRLRNAKAKTEMYRTFLESKTVLPEFRAEVRGFLERSSSAFQDSIQGLTDVQVNAKVDSLILDDPTFRSTLVSVYEQRADPKKTLSGEKEVQDLDLALAKLQAQLQGEVSPTDLTAAQSDLTAKETALTTALTATSISLTDVASWQSELDNLTPQINEARATKKNLQVAHDAIESQISTLDSALSGMAATDPNYLKMVNGLGQLRSRPELIRFQQADSIVQRYDAAKTGLNALTTTQRISMSEYSTAQENLRSLKERASGAKSPTERADLEAQIKNIKIELADAKDRLDAEMIQDYRDVTHMAADATQQILATELPKLAELYRTAATEDSEKQDIQKTKDKETLDAATEKLHKVWKDPRMRRGVMSLVTNEGRASNMFNAWLQQGHEGVRGQLRGITRPDLVAAGLTPNEITLFRSTLADADKAKAYLADQADVIAAGALSDYFVSGGRFGRAEKNAFTASPQGRALIKMATTEVDAQRSAKDELAGRGILKGVDNIIGGRASGERRKFGPTRVGLAMLLLMVGAAAFRGAKS